MIDYVILQHQKWLTILAVFAVVTLVEIMVNPRKEQVGIGDRLRNIGAGSALLIVGGYLGYRLTVSLDQLHIFTESKLSTIAYVSLFVLLQDFIYYFYHRLQHSWWFLWGFHKLHHTDTDVNITTSHRTHILEKPVQTLLIAAPVLLFLGYHPAGLLYVTLLNLFFLYLGHARVNLNLGWLSRLFVGPCFHRVHHSASPEHLNKNFAQFFSFLDLVFGTYARPQPIGEIETGVPGCTARRDQWAPMVWPLPELRKFDRKVNT